MNENPETRELATASLGATTVAGQLADAHVLWKPTELGRYKIRRLLGQGGMGAVYEAEQDNPRRLVALKVIKPGMTTASSLLRFERETEALGRLQHPGIAQIYEAGTEDAGFGPQPFFAMEFVRGLSLREHAETRNLPLRQRLELIAKICDAVHHAHQRGLIHRDLKPSSILVDESGQPKILDFGVARVTDSDTQATRQTDIGQLVGTLAYMSPEQVLADPLELDTRSDVYALGVVLYELLAGKLPYSLSHKLHEAMLTIREQDPAPLSSVSRIYRGDIETIVAKALEKDKARRYTSAADLAADIRRHLNDEPIVARPASFSYQLRKLARRHTALMGGIAAVFVVLVAGVIVSTREAVLAKHAQKAAIVQADRATEAQHAADQEREKAVTAGQQAKDERNKAVASQRAADNEAATSRAISDFLQTDLLGQASAAAQARPDNKPDPDLKVRTAVDRAAATVAGRFAGKPLVEASLRQTLGDTYQGLGLYPEAQREYEKALSLRRVQLGETQIETLDSLYALGNLFVLQGKPVQAEPLLVELRDINRRRWGEGHLKTIKSANALAAAYLGEGKWDLAESVFLSSLQNAQRSLGNDNSETLAIMNNLSGIYYQRAKYSQAVEMSIRVLDINRRTLGAEHPTTLLTMSNLAVFELALGRLGESESLRKQVIEIQQKVLGPEHPDTLRSIRELANVYQRQGKLKEAEPLLRETAEAQSRVLGAEHPETLITLNVLAGVSQRLGNLKESEELFQRVLAARRRVRGEEHPSTLVSMNNLAVLYLLQQKYKEAEPIFARAVEGYRRAFGAEHPETLVVIANLGRTYMEQGELDQTQALMGPMVEISSRALGTEHATTNNGRAYLGYVLIKLGKFGEAEPLLQEALRAWQKTGPNTWGRINAQSLLGASLAGQKKFSEAEPLLRAVLQEMLDHRKDIPHESGYFFDSAGEALVRLYQDTGQADKASDWQTKLQSTPAR